MIKYEVQRRCLVCGKAITRTNMLYCGPVCRRVSSTEKQRERRERQKELKADLPTRACKVCGVIFPVTSPNKIYCSMSCQALRPRTKYRPPPKIEEYRSCLKCDKEFRSTGKDNRICITCNKENELLCIGSEIAIWLGEGHH